MAILKKWEILAVFLKTPAGKLNRKQISESIDQFQ